MNYCGDPECKRKVHFESPEFCQFFKWAYVQKADGTIETIRLPKPTWYMDEPDDGLFHGFGNFPLTGSPDDCTIVNCPGKSGVQKDDPYYLEMDRIKKEYDNEEELTKLIT